MNANNLSILQDTLTILQRGNYTIHGKTVNLKLTAEQMKEVQVFLPKDIEDIANRTDFPKRHTIERCGHGCENMDSFSLARKRCNDCSHLFTEDAKKEILVLNLANPVHPGGGVRHGARAQEEDLCRKSSLLLSLESEDAQKYYRYNSSLHTKMGSDAIILTPHVEIIKDENGDPLEDSVIVSVMTCAAPMITLGKEGLSENEYKALLEHRIAGMLTCAAYWRYEVLILGAFGCGAFGNDAKTVSDIFYKVLKKFRFNGMSEADCFRRIDFAVLDKSPDQYNFKEFYRNFSSDNFFI